MDSSILNHNHLHSDCLSCYFSNNEEDHTWLEMSEKCNLFETETQHRRLKTNTPCEKKDAKYYERRMRNNIAAKKSREAKRRRENEMALKVYLIEKENILLKFRLRAVVEELNAVKRSLIVYNANKLFGPIIV